MSQKHHCATGNGKLIIQSFTKIESGRRNDRPQLAAALKACRRHKAALQVAKARGTKLGSPDPKKGAAIRSRELQDKADRFTALVLPVIRELQAEGITSHKALAKALNALGIPTANTRKWYGTTVKNLLARPSTHKKPRCIKMSASMPNPSVLQGLIFIKYLYNLGISQSNQPRPMKASCLLSFHDAVENFMGLACTKESITISRNITFDKYFVEYEKATERSISRKSEMNYLNNCRVSLKHYGAPPSDETVSKVKIDVSEFFEINTPLIFNTSFEELSMSDPVSSDKVKDLLRKSEDHKKEGRLADAVGKCAEALYVIIKEYKSNISKDWDSHTLDFGNERTVEDAILEKNDKNNDRRNKVRNFANAYERMSDAITIIGFGIDYRKYAKFMMIAPGVIKMSDGSVHYGRNKDLSGITTEEFQFCYDFVIETALKIQEFAIDPDALSTTRTAKKAREWNEEARRMMAEQERAAE